MEHNYLTYNKLVKALKMPVDSFKTIRIAVLAEFAAQHYVKALKSALINEKVNAIIWEADYNAVDVTILSNDSGLYDVVFDYVVILTSVHKLYKEFSHHNSATQFSDEKSEHLQHLIELLGERSPAKIILTNYQELNDGVFGNFANKTSYSFLYQLRKLNAGIMDLAKNNSNVYIADVQSFCAYYGHSFVFDAKMYIHADLVFSLDFIAVLAVNTTKIIGSILGNIIKCVILDLDNTLWGGIIGDDGIENINLGDLGIGKAFTGLQQWLLNLKNRGIILAVCSKNTDSIAREVFEKHPGMVLKMQDISVFVANWETKVDNIRFIQSVLNIGYDSIVFLDDNPFERDMVRQHINGIVVPELPEDPAEYLIYLQQLNLFETASFVSDDSNRTKQYQEEAGRKQLQKSFANEDEFLASLNMKAVIKPADSFTCPRVAQLTQRSNQFNLRTVRYTDADIKKIMVSDSHKTITVSLADKYGDYGMISTVILEKIADDTMFIDTWIMSCRVLKRGVESLVLDEIISVAQESACKFIEGEYLPTAKNGLVKDHYSGLGFDSLPVNNRYRLNVSGYTGKTTFITKTSSYAKHE